MSCGEHKFLQVQEEADRLFHSGWNCAESVFQAVHKQFRDEAPPVHLLTAFGGGMGCKRTCGAVTGAMAALGITAGRTSPDEGRKKIACGKAHDFCGWFRQEFHSLDCWELTADFPDESARKSRCTEFVRGAAGRACELMTETTA